MAVTGLPDDFVWGVSTSAYQIEGATLAGGRGESIWDRFTAVDGRVSDGSDGSITTDHYHRWEEDLELLTALGVGAYRFSLAWPRLQPGGRGGLAAAGVDFYDRLLDGLLARGIDPWVCLYHWDLPQALQDKGGWPLRDCAYYFADYAERVAALVAGRSKHLFLLNEPNVHAVMGHLLGLHAPGTSDIGDFFAALHHQNLASGMGVERLREAAPGAALGTILNLQPVLAGARGEEHEAAAGLVDAVYNRGVLDPLLLGSYPATIEGFLEPYLKDGDLAQASRPIDLLGVNHYTRLYVLADPDGPAGLALGAPPAGSEVTDMGWEVAPDALFAQLLELKNDYGNPAVVITENGAAYSDRQEPAGGIEDQGRTAYLASYIGAAARALGAGCDVRGYFAWTLVDNFEWSFGFDKRFGLVHLDRRTLARTPKRSFAAFRQIVAANGVPDEFADSDL